jgi:hypothetical protein
LEKSEVTGIGSVPLPEFFCGGVYLGPDASFPLIVILVCPVAPPGVVGRAWFVPVL